MQLIKVTILLAGIFLSLLNDSKDDMLFLAESKNNLVKNEKNKKKDKESTEAGITVIKRWELPKILTEISGLSCMDEQRFACVQDELGKIFVYNIASSKV